VNSIVCIPSLENLHPRANKGIKNASDDPGEIPHGACDDRDEGNIWFDNSDSRNGIAYREDAVDVLRPHDKGDR
jgi:hypothetical protein